MNKGQPRPPEPSLEIVISFAYGVYHRNSAEYIYDPDYIPSATDLENKKVWDSYPIEFAAYLALLDRWTVHDDLYAVLRGAALTHLLNNGIRHFGDVIAMTPEELQARSGLSAAQVARVVRVVERQGFPMPADVSAWRDYRRSVDQDFSLVPPRGAKLPDLNGRARVT